jgi:hypothetical protein
MILATPKQAPFPVESFFLLGPNEKSKRALTLSTCATSVPCSTPVRIGIFFDGTTSTERVLKVSGLAWQKILDKPCAPDVVKAIQTIAAHNAKIYEEVFQHTPRNSLKTFAACTSFHTLPYAALYEAAAASDEIAPKMTYASGQPVFRQMTEKEEADLAKKANRVWQKLEDTAGKNELYAGVIPPALQAQFMTAELLPHQKAALNAKTYGRRQQLYAGGTVHDVRKAIIYLKENVVGFFVAMPLDWGMGTAIENDPTQHATVDIASNDSPYSAEKGSQT